MRQQISRLPLVTLLLAGCTVFIHFICDLQLYLQYARPAILSGDLWRLITAHLCHWSFDHLFWDFLVFVVLGSVCELRWPGSYLKTLFLSAVLISSALLFFEKEMITYRGLSGIDSALFCLVCGKLFIHSVRTANRTGIILTAALFALLLAKSGYEATASHTLFVTATETFVVVPLAHLVGGAVGLLFGVASRPVVTPAIFLLGRP
ncbi:MAG: rhombosortase [Thermodesulfobacteriota bacterium]